MTQSEAPGAVTRALDGHAGDPRAALGEVLPLVYAELRSLAGRTLARGGRVTLRPTELVHETYVKLRDQERGWADRAGLMLAASFAMRRVLVDHVRRRRAAKRGDGRVAEDDVERIAIHDRTVDVLDLEDALARLEQDDPAAAEVACLRLFGGLGGAECAAALDVSTRTIERRWRFARAWLVTELGDPA